MLHPKRLLKLILYMPSIPIIGLLTMYIDHKLRNETGIVEMSYFTERELIEVIKKQVKYLYPIPLRMFVGFAFYSYILIM